MSKNLNNKTEDAETKKEMAKRKLKKQTKTAVLKPHRPTVQKTNDKFIENLQLTNKKRY